MFCVVIDRIDRQTNNGAATRSDIYLQRTVVVVKIHLQKIEFLSAWNWVTFFMCVIIMFIIIIILYWKFHCKQASKQKKPTSCMQCCYLFYILSLACISLAVLKIDIIYIHTHTRRLESSFILTSTHMRARAQCCSLSFCYFF